MPYGDPDKQKAYLRAYYHKYLKKPTTKRGGNLKIDLMNYKPKPLGDVRNTRPSLDHYTKPLKFEYDFLDTEAKVDTKGNVVDFLDYNGNLKTAKQLKKEIDEDYYTRKNKTPRQPTKPLLKAINLYEDDYQKEEEDEVEKFKPPKSLEYYTDKESYLRNPFLLKIQDEPAFFSQVKEDIPRWISKMTDTNIKSKIDEVSRCLTDEEFDEIIDYCNKLFGKHKSRTKLEYAYKEMMKTCNSK